ncbi:hypothetical protein [Nitrobacter sp. JJSN]
MDAGFVVTLHQKVFAPSVTRHSIGNAGVARTIASKAVAHIATDRV